MPRKPTTTQKLHLNIWESRALYSQNETNFSSLLHQIHLWVRLTQLFCREAPLWKSSEADARVRFGDPMDIPKTQIEVAWETRSAKILTLESPPWTKSWIPAWVTEMAARPPLKIGLSGNCVWTQSPTSSPASRASRGKRYFCGFLKIDIEFI